jgi:hypothetical protein
MFVLFNGADENLISQGRVGMLKAQNKGSLMVHVLFNGADENLISQDRVGMLKAQNKGSLMVGSL